jgi:phosphohistidine phosphatase
MKFLILARHGTAQDRLKATDDFERALTGKGKAESEFAGRKLKLMQVMPELVMSSPAARALSTAIVICNKINYPQNKIISTSPLYEGRLRGIVSLLRNVSNHITSVMLVGHNPMFDELYGYLCERPSVSIKKGEVAALILNIGSWAELNKNTGRYYFYVSQKTNQTKTLMKNKKSQSKKKDLKEQLAVLINAFAKSMTNTDSKKIHKAVKEASKLLAKAILKSMKNEKRSVEKKKTKPVKKKKPAANKRSLKAKSKPKPQNKPKQKPAPATIPASVQSLASSETQAV